MFQRKINTKKIQFGVRSKSVFLGIFFFSHQGALGSVIGASTWSCLWWSLGSRKALEMFPLYIRCCSLHFQDDKRQCRTSELCPWQYARLRSSTNRRGTSVRENPKDRRHVPSLGKYLWPAPHRCVKSTRCIRPLCTSQTFFDKKYIRNHEVQGQKGCRIGEMKVGEFYQNPPRIPHTAALELRQCLSRSNLIKVHVFKAWYGKGLWILFYRVLQR